MEDRPTYEELARRVEALEEELRENERKDADLRRLAVIVRDSNDAVTVQDLEGNIKAWNQGAEKMFGYSEEEARSMNIREIIPEEKQDEALALIEQIEKGVEVESFETQRVTKDGRLLDVWLTVTALTDDAGAPNGVATTERDVTEKNRMLMELRRNSEETKLFAYSISHDLKGPAIALYGLNRSFYGRYKDQLDQKGKEIYERILRASEDMKALVEELNFYISSKEGPLKPEKFDLKEAVDRVYAEFSRQIRNRGIRWSAPERLPEIRADRLSVFRALKNLVENSLKYGGEALSEIDISYKDAGAFHVLSVYDDGSGIRKEDREKIFDPFQRKGEEGIKGMGLGLSIVKEVAERHGGKVWLEEDVEEGVRFCFSLAKG